MSKRDSQRSRLYKAEQMTRAIYDEPIGKECDIELRAKLCRTFVNEVMKRKYIQRKYPKAVAKGWVEVEISKGAYAFARAWGGHTIKLPSAGSWAYTKLVMLHELAHIIEHRENGRKHAPHDWAFAAIFLDIVRNVMGKKVADNLKQEYRRNRVRFKPKAKRSLTPEQREAARARMAKARAVRDANLAFKREAIAAYRASYEGYMPRWACYVGTVKGVPVSKHPEQMTKSELEYLKKRIDRYNEDRVREAMMPELSLEERRRRQFVSDTMLQFNVFRPTSFVTVTGI